eukprot:5461996-Pyramimonas_sp.AAC.1
MACGTSSGVSLGKSGSRLVVQVPAIAAVLEHLIDTYDAVFCAPLFDDTTVADLVQVSPFTIGPL